MSAMNLYPRSPFRATAALLLVALIAVSVLVAQRRPAHKLRATALLELSTDSKGVKTARVTPIVILDEGNFHDASIYKAAPQPMALESGVVYEAEKSGVPVGFVTVSTAAKDRIWKGLGKWQAESDRPKAKPSATPVQSASDERPRLHRSGEAAPQSSPTPSPSASPQSSGSDDRPVLHRSANGAPSQATPSPSASPASSHTQAPAPQVTPEEPSASVDPDRPTLRRGKPTPTPAGQANASLTANSAASPAAPSTPATGSPASAKPSTSPAPGTQVMVAVSDAEPGDSRSFQFMWKPGEEAPIVARLRHQAAERLSQGDVIVSERDLKNVVVRSFDLDLTNDAILVLTAELPPGSGSVTVKPTVKTKIGRAKAALPAASASANSPGVTHYITLISRVDLEGNPQLLATNLTDSSRLDIAPRLELVDAVDVDGDGIGELLFREYDFDNQGFVIYGVRHGAVSKMFEGASQALK